MILNDFSEFPDEAKIWLYTSDRNLSINEINDINKEFKIYTEQWFSHGKSLHASAKLITPFLLCFVVDNTKVHASGCSIDDSVKFIKSLSEKYKITFFNRLIVWIKIDNDYKDINFNQLENFQNAEIINLQAKTLKEFKENPLLKVHEYLNTFCKV